MTDPKVDRAIGVPKSAAPGASDEEAAGGRAGRRPVGEKRGPTMQMQPRVGQNQDMIFFLWAGVR